MPKLEQFLSIEALFEKFSARRWRAAFGEIREDLLEALQAADFKTAEETLGGLRLPAPTKAEIKTLRAYGLTALQFGTATVRKTAASNWLKPDADLTMLDRAVEQFFLVEQSAAVNLASGVLSSHIEGAVTAAAGKQTVLQIRRAEAAGDLVPQDYGYEINFKPPDWTVALSATESGGIYGTEIGANLATSRLVNYGALHRMRAERVAVYMLKAKLDAKTSQICQHMHGKKFRVRDAIEILERALLVQNVKDLAVIHPWIPSTKAVLAELPKISNAELEKRGWQVPPFHARCRTVVVKAREKRPWK